MDEMEYTTLPEVMAKLEGRWQSLNGQEPESLAEVGVKAEG